MGRALAGGRLCSTPQKGIQETHRALERIGGGEYTLLLFDESAAVRTEIDEAQSARELSQLHVSHIMGDFREEVAGARSDEENSAARARAQRRLAKWSVLRRGICRITVLATDGSAIYSGVDSAEVLRAHWGLAFSYAAGISMTAADRFLHHVQPFTDELHRLDFSEVCAVASHVNRSSLGPDGVP